MHHQDDLPEARPQRGWRTAVYWLALAGGVCASCTTEFPPDLLAHTCGNGVIEYSEACDDGNTGATDGCDATCQIEAGFTCTGEPSTCTRVASCGDGAIVAPETCDDGNTAVGDGCNAACQVEAGFTCTGSPSVCTPIPVCGDGVTAGSEQCDDGNTAASDGCSASCQVEPGWSCTGQPSACVFTCGDGIVDPSEACDDGNAVDGDGCNALCQVDCANASTTDCNPTGETLVATSAYVDQSPPAGFVQCAGFQNTAQNDVAPNWEANCLGTERVLRLRYWDTSVQPWVLLGDAVLDATSTAAYATQTFDATNVSGSEGILATAGVIFLKDDPASGAPPTTWECFQSHPQRFYGANDFYLANQANTSTLAACSWSLGDDAAAICADEDELQFSAVALGQCSQAAGMLDLAVSIYYQR